MDRENYALRYEGLRNDAFRGVLRDGPSVPTMAFSAH